MNPRHSRAVLFSVLLLSGCGSSSDGEVAQDVDAGADAIAESSSDAIDDTIPAVDTAADSTSDTGGCPAMGTALGDACPHLLAAICTPDAAKLYVCGKVDECLVWTEGTTCSAGTACQQTGADTATCCIAPGTTTGSGCPSSGATTCTTGGKVLTCAAPAAGECRVWSDAADCPTPKKCPSGASSCACPAAGTGAGEGCVLGTTSCQPGGKIYSCATQGGCDVFTLSTTCATGACGSKGTCCPALGATAGAGCTTEGATSCGSGATTLLTCTRATDGCLTWVATTCTASLVCGGTPAACQCPAQYPITKYVVDPSSSNAAWRPTGTTQPGCSFARLTDALAAPRPTGSTALPIVAQGATVKPAWAPSTAYAAAAAVSPVWSNGHFYTAQAAGTSAATEPTWCTTSGCTVVDGGVTWKESGVAKVVELADETFPIVIKGNVRVWSSGCEFGSTGPCTPNGYVIRFKGPTAYAAVDVAAIGAIPLFRGYRVANDSATPPAAMVKTSSGSVDLTYIEVFGDSDVNTVRAATGFLSTGGNASIRYSSARHCSGFGAVISNTCTLTANTLFANDGGGVSATSGGLTASDNVVIDNTGVGVAIGPTSSVTWSRGRIGGNSGDGVRVTTPYDVSIDGTSVDHDGAAGVRVENGKLTLVNASVFRNGGGGVVFPAGTTSATLVAFKNDQVACNTGAQVAFYTPQAGGAAYDLSGGDTACGSPTAATRIYGYGGSNPGTIGVLNDPANPAGVNASFVSWASGASSPSSGTDFSGLTAAQATSAATQSCSFAPPACPP